MLMKDGLLRKSGVMERIGGRMDFFEKLLVENGVKESYAGFLSYGIMILIVILISILVYLIAKRIVLKILTKIINNNKYQWDNSMLERKVFHRAILILPGIIFYVFAPVFTEFQNIIRIFASTYLLIVAVFVISSLLDAINDIYSTYPISKVRPIKGLLQVIKIIVYIIMGIVIIAILLNQEILILLSGIGALTAVFSFVFRDSILGFIAGIQLTANDMLRIGDWIEMPKHGADGDVIDITMNTVKVQNFDKTIVTLPAYALISDSFKNWRGMKDSGGRRIKRSVYIDVNSIVFCTQEMIERYKQIYYLKDYIIDKEKEIAEYNYEHKVTESELQINGRRMTNIGTFRAYIMAYLRNHPRLNKDMTMMVRQLPPDEKGLPLEIYAFSSEIVWEGYEAIQSDIFDHIFSVAEVFGLRFFQNPSGYDVKHISFDAANGPKE